jgi:hypothetical protein
VDNFCVPTPLIPETSVCDATLCSKPCPPCPPISKAVHEIWNENEIRFMGTERCIYAFDERLISVYTDDLISVPNFYKRTALQTDRGRARIDGMTSPGVCGPESIDSPLLGVQFKQIQFPNDRVEVGATTLVGVGVEPARLIAPPLGPPPEEGLKGDDRMNDADPLEPAGQGDEVASVSEKGSVLIYPKFEVKWNSAQNLIQDTFIQISNDFTQDVDLLILYVNGNGCVCNSERFDASLTKRQPVYWSVATGNPYGLPPVTVLDPSMGEPDDDPLNEGGRVMRGYVVIYAINAEVQEINWNHLHGLATIVNYELSASWEYSPWAFRALQGEQGSVLREPFAQLDFDGVEYTQAPDKLLFEFMTPGSELKSKHNRTATVLDTDLTLIILNRDLTQGPQP